MGVGVFGSGFANYSFGLSRQGSTMIDMIPTDGGMFACCTESMRFHDL
jgi:hypothetical protein